MSRELPAFRDNLERLDVKFPDQELLNKKEIKEYLGISYQSIRRNMKLNEFGKMSKVVLARYLSQEWPTNKN